MSGHQATNFPRPHISQPCGEGRVAGLQGGDQGASNGPLTHPLRVLVACEFSGVVRRAFRALGHKAWSCDLLPSEDNSPYHYQCDFREVTGQQWDFVGYHVDCRVMANSGVRWLDIKPGRRQELVEAAALFNLTLRDPRPGYVENSVMHCHAKALINRPQDQTIQPWWFGVPRFKATCLWLRGGIKPLVPTNKLTPPAKGTLEHKQWSAVHRASPGPNRWKERSRTFEGVAAAMASQWGGPVAPRCRSCSGDLGIDALGSGLCASCRRDRLESERYSGLEDEMDRGGVDDDY